MLEAARRLGAARVVVTGAGGFIGGRLVEALAAAGLELTAVVRDYGRAARLGRLGVKLVRADLRDPQAVRALLDDAELVFHCAYGWRPDQELERAENLAASLNVGLEARRLDRVRLVHVSTMAVYGHDLPPIVDEDTPPRPGTPYGATKLEIERELAALAAGGAIDLRVVRATKVFGPYDAAFTVSTVTSLLERRLRLIEGGSGLVAPSYVDNLVYGLLLAAAPGAPGGIHVISDGVDMTWRELYGRFSSITSVGPSGDYVRGRTPVGKEPSPPSELEYRDFTRRGAYSIARAQRDLGYRPVVGFEEAMSRTASWLRFAGIISERASDAAAL
jgi:nucleoside-diphosphate-sugar epimerase